MKYKIKKFLDRVIVIFFSIFVIVFIYSNFKQTRRLNLCKRYLTELSLAEIKNKGIKSGDEYIIKNIENKYTFYIKVLSVDDSYFRYYYEYGGKKEAVTSTLHGFFNSNIIVSKL